MIHMKCQDIFYEKQTKIECRLLQILLGTLRVKCWCIMLIHACVFFISNDNLLDLYVLSLCYALHGCSPRRPRRIGQSLQIVGSIPGKTPRNFRFLFHLAGNQIIHPKNHVELDVIKGTHCVRLWWGERYTAVSDLNGKICISIGIFIHSACFAFQCILPSIKRTEYTYTRIRFDSFFTWNTMFARSLLKRGLL